MASENRSQRDPGQNAGQSDVGTGIDAPRVVRGEHRLPVILTLLAAIALPFLLPERLGLGPRWLFPVLVGTFIVATLVTAPDLISRRATVLRIMANGVVVVLIIEASWSTTHLLIELINGGPETNRPDLLLLTGAVVWIGNNIVFALLYWELDSGGPTARASRTVRYPDFAFPGHLNPQIVPPDWRPVFIDYLYLGYTNALAFSPTDVMPLTHWAKLTMALQSLISVVILSLVIARAVNILT
jgi:uncharacterized membrane protein